MYLTSELHGMEAAFEKYRSTGRSLDHNTYCGILVGAAVGGRSYDRVVSIALTQAPALRPQSCDDRVLLAFVGRERYEEIAEKLPQLDLTTASGTVIMTTRRLAATPPTPVVARVRDSLVDRCVYKFECGQPRAPSRPWNDLLLLLVLHGEPAERLNDVVARLLEIGHDLASPGLDQRLRAAARRIGPGQMDVLMQAVGRAMTGPVKLHLRAEARAHAGDLAGALELVQQIDQSDIRVDALVGVTAATWRRENSAALEILSAYSAKNREYE